MSNNLAFQLAIAALLLLLMAGAASAVGNANVAQVGDTIYVWGANAWANLTDIQTTVNNNSALSVSGTVFLAGANIHINGTTTTLYINDTDATELRLNSTSRDISVLWVNGSLEMNNSKIVGWNTTTADYEYQNTSDRLDDPNSYIRIGDGTNNVSMNISNSFIYNLGYNNSKQKYGLYTYKWVSGTIRNSTISYLYEFYLEKSSFNNIQSTNIHNNSWRAIEIFDSSHNNTFSDLDIYNNGWVAQLDVQYGSGGVLATSPYNNYLTFRNITIRDGYGGVFTIGTGEQTQVINLTLTNSTGNSPQARGFELNNAIFPANGTVRDSYVDGYWRGLYNVYGETNKYYNNTVKNSTDGGLVVYNMVGMPYGTMYNNTLYNNQYNILFTAGVNDSIVNNNTITLSKTGGYDIGITSSGNNNNSVVDLEDADRNISIYYGSSTGVTLFNYTNNRIMNVSVLPNKGYNYTYRHTTTESSVSLNHSAYQSGYPLFATVLFFNSTLRPNENDVVVDYLHNDRLTIDYQNLTIQHVNFTLSDVTKMNVTLNNVTTGANYSLFYAGNDTYINSSIAASPVYFNLSLGNDDYYITETMASTYIPPVPITLANTTGNFWVNHTWAAGAGNVTNSFNVSQNGTWTNGSANTYFNATVGAGNWSNITVFGQNSSGTGTLSLASASMNTQAPTSCSYWQNVSITISSDGTKTCSAIGSVLINMSVLPDTDSVTLNAAVWDNSSSYRKLFNVTSSNTSVTFALTVCDFQANTYQNINTNSTLLNISMSNATGCVAYNYTSGNVSELQFEIVPASTNPVAYAVAIAGAATVALLYLGRTRRTEIAQYLARRKQGRR